MLSPEPAGSSSSASSRWLVPVILVSAVSPFATDAYLPAFPTLVVDLGLTSPLVQTTLTAFVIAFAAGQLIGGTVSDRHGPKNTIIVSSLLFSVGSAVCVVADGLGSFNAARALEGVGAGAAVAAARGVVADHSTGVVLARRLGLLFTVLVLAPICAPSLGSVVISAFGWRAVFAGLAGLGVLMTALTAALIPPHRSDVDARETGVLAGFTAVLRVRRYRRWLLGSCFSAVAGFTYVGFSPFILQQQLRLSSTGFTVVFTANAVGLTLASLVFRSLVGRVEALVLVRLGAAVGTVAAAVLAVVTVTGRPTIASVAPLLGVAVAVTGLVIPATTVLLQQAGQQASATAGALQGASNYAVGAVAAPVLAALAGPTLLLLALVLAVSAAAQLILAATADPIANHMRQADDEVGALPQPG